MGVLEGSVYVKHTDLGNEATVDGSELRLIIGHTLVSIELPEHPEMRRRLLRTLCGEAGKAMVSISEI